MVCFKRMWDLLGGCLTVKNYVGVTHRGMMGLVLVWLLFY